MKNLAQVYATAIQLHQQLDDIAVQFDDPALTLLTTKVDELAREIGCQWAGAERSAQ